MGDTPNLVRIGTTVKGRDALLHPTAAALWAVTVPLVDQRLGIDLTGRIAQAYGSADASAGIHGAPACAVDIRVWNLTGAQRRALVALLRDCGWEGTWDRDWDGNEHIHACTDIGIWTPALYQVKAARAGYDGRGRGGRKGRDPHPAPTIRRTAKQGTIWAAAQLIPTPVPEEDIMASADELRQIIREEIDRGAKTAIPTGVWAATFGSATETAGVRLGRAASHAVVAAARVADITRGGKAIALRQEVADAKTMLLQQRGAIAGLTAALSQLTGGGKVDLAAVTAAAKRGVEDALGDLSLTATITTDKA